MTKIQLKSPLITAAIEQLNRSKEYYFLQLQLVQGECSHEEIVQVTYDSGRDDFAKRFCLNCGLYERFSQTYYHPYVVLKNKGPLGLPTISVDEVVDLSLPIGIGDLERQMLSHGRTLADALAPQYLRRSM